MKMSNQDQENDFATTISKYPAFQYKVTGVIENSRERSETEEVSLCLNLVKNIKLQSHQKNICSVYYLFNTSVTSTIQGFRKPICGLVALHMAGNMLRQNNSTVPNQKLVDIYHKAIDSQVSKQGEMFSAYDMAELASNIYKCQAKVLTGNMFDNRETLLFHILHGHPILVPYDNDKNFEPCLKYGHKAHWAVLTGAVIKISSGLSWEGVAGKFEEESNVFRIKKEDHSQFLDVLFCSLEKIESIHVYVKQGKSAKNRLWCLHALARSNSNLYERDPERDWSAYHCPYLLRETLKDKVVVLT